MLSAAAMRAMYEKMLFYGRPMHQTISWDKWWDHAIAGTPFGTYTNTTTII